jgi:prolyl-tRNA editing enzyme YbaK/EbsC (Cys-tRNA(Pro) deacylase)
MSNFITTMEDDDNDDADLKLEVALRLLSDGQATVRECAELRGVSRQAMYKAISFDVRSRRKQHLKQLWTNAIKQLS